jgi:palmitoyl-protein thioesterase
LGPAGYFRDPRDLDKYLADSVFLPYVNNENTVDQSIIERFTALNGAMFVMFDADTVVYPRESEWFWELQANGSITKVEDTDFYKNDLIGLKQLNEAGKV